jgi:hypothetical protein
MKAQREHEIMRNFEAFQAEVPDIISENEGKFALMHAARIQEFFGSLADAIVAGHRKYSNGMFSIQQVSTETLDLGYFSHADSEGTLRQR